MTCAEMRASGGLSGLLQLLKPLSIIGPIAFDAATIDTSLRLALRRGMRKLV